MLYRGVPLLCLCFVAMQMLQVAANSVPLVIDPEVKARLEEQVMSSMSLKEIEEMVENDERVRNSPKSEKIIIIPKNKNGEALIGEDDREAIIIHRKPKKAFRQTENIQQRFGDIEFDRGIRRSSYEPAYSFEDEFRHSEESFPSLFRISDLESAGSSPAEKFYESIVSRVIGSQKFGLARDPLAVLEIAASENAPQYKPRFDYDAYSKDSTDTKLQGKPYWKEAPERRDEMVDENGCRTVVKKVVDPEDEKKSGSAKAKSVVITKECEYPNINGPDAKITEATPLRRGTSRFDKDPGYENYDNQPIAYDQDRPEELDFKPTEGRDPLAPDYIDSMLEKHFKSFPGFTNPLSSFKGYQDRFKLRAPEGFKDVKPTVGVQTYEYSNPKSGFDDEEQRSDEKESVSRDSPKKYEHHYHYDYPPQDSRKPEYDDDRDRDGKQPAGKSSDPKDSPKKYEHHHHYDYPPQDSRKTEYDDDRDGKQAAGKSSDPKEPKMMKKSFAYYRKDNPKDDPNDHQYAEEYAQGNYRSFSSSYDSEKDGPKKQ